MKLGLAIAFSMLAACAANTAPVASAAKPMNESIAGTKWIQPIEGDAADKPRLEFSADGRVTGYTGCNSVSGTWRVDGDVVRLGPLVMTKRACPGVRDDLERKFLEAVNAEGSLSIESGRLIAQGKGGARLELSRAP